MTLSPLRVSRLMLVDDSGSIDELIRFDAHSARTPAHGTRRTCRDVPVESVVRTIADIRLLGATQGKRSKSLPLSEVRATIDRNRTMEKTHDPYIVRRPEARNRRLLRSRPATRLRCRED